MKKVFSLVDYMEEKETKENLSFLDELGYFDLTIGDKTLRFLKKPLSYANVKDIMGDSFTKNEKYYFKTSSPFIFNTDSHDFVKMVDRRLGFMKSQWKIPRLYFFASIHLTLKLKVPDTEWYSNIWFKDFEHYSKKDKYSPAGIVLLKPL